MLYLAMGLVLTGGLYLKQGASDMSIPMGVATVLYAAVSVLAPRGSKWRLFASFVATWGIYVGSSCIILALHAPTDLVEEWRHRIFGVVEMPTFFSEDVLGWDRKLFGETPSVALQGTLPAGVADLLSLSYMSYQIYIHWSLITVWFLGPGRRAVFSHAVFTTFAVGFTGYFLLPTMTPANAFPHLFREGIAGGSITSFNTHLNRVFAAEYDAFPSLHVLVTMTLLALDWRFYRRRFYIMIVPSILMAVGALYLRFHYAVDVMASLCLFAGLQYVFHRTGLYDAEPAPFSSRT